MCETYSERGLEHASIMDLGTGGWNFLLVAVGGTVIGEYIAYNCEMMNVVTCDKRYWQ